MCCAIDEISMDFLWDSMDFLGVCHGFLWIFHGFPVFYGFRLSWDQK